MVFAGLLLLSSWHLDEGHNDNTMSRAAMVAALVEHGTLHIDTYEQLTGDKAVLNGHFYSDKAPLPALVVTPFWWVAARTGLAQPGEHGLLTDGLLRLGGFLCGSVPFALIITLLALRLVRAGVPLPHALYAAALPMFGSFLFVYSGSFYSHLPGACLLLLGALAFEREQWWRCGAWCGAAVLCEYTLAVVPIVVCAVLLLQRRWTPLMQVVAGGVPWALLLMGYNVATTGHALEPLYAHEAHYTFMEQRMGFALPTADALFGLTLSPYRGLLWYMPALAVLLAYAIGRIAWGEGARPSAYTWAALAGIVAVSGYAMWWGGWAYGPRHLCATAVLLLLACPIALLHDLRWRTALHAASIVGLLMAWSAKSTVWYSLPTEERMPFRTIILPHLANSDWNAWQWPVRLGLSPMSASLLFLLIFAAALLVLPRAVQRFR